MKASEFYTYLLNCGCTLFDGSRAMKTLIKHGLVSLSEDGQWIYVKVFEGPQSYENARKAVARLKR